MKLLFERKAIVNEGVVGVEMERFFVFFNCLAVATGHAPPRAQPFFAIFAGDLLNSFTVKILKFKNGDRRRVRSRVTKKPNCTTFFFTRTTGHTNGNAPALCFYD